MRQLDAHKKEPNYWIEYTDGTTRTFFAENDLEAHHYFMMEGDHAHNFGHIDAPLYPPAAVDGWMEVVDEDEGKVKHRTRSGKGLVGQAIARHKLPPNCS